MKTFNFEIKNPGKIKQTLSRCILRLWGWKIEGELPDAPRYLYLFEPHTSNRDGFVTYFVTVALGIRLRWLGKHTLFELKPFIGRFLIRIGGIPVDHNSPAGLVEQVANKIKQQERCILAIMPSGSRFPEPHWKSGFYRIARHAEIPVLCVYIDNQRKVVGFADFIHLTGNVKYDMDRIRLCYRTAMGDRAEINTPIRLRNEETNLG